MERDMRKSLAPILDGKVGISTATVFLAFGDEATGESDHTW